ncbi:MAG TPA: histidine phosphatase family protein [Peptostreptococcaceae bacterium]|nr:histidine phosphatase family protein [Peptostreptococcaceae bacterium]
MVRIILVRHGETDDNNNMKLSGHIDSKLSSLGLSQSQRTVNFLKDYNIDYIYSSPSSRAIDTIKSLAKEKCLDIIINENLKEMNFGDFEGKTFKEIESSYSEELDNMLKLGFEYGYPNGESLVEFHNRIALYIENIIKQNIEKSILICTHAGVIRCIISHLLSKSYEHHWNFKIDNCSVSVIEIENDFAVIHKLNNTDHIR